MPYTIDPPGKYTIDPPADSGSWYGALGHGVLHGLGDVVYGGAQLGARMQEPTAFGEPAPSLASRVDNAASEREAQYQADPITKAHPIASGLGRFGGEVAANAPLMALPGGQASLPVRLGIGAATGAAAAATEPVTGGGSFWAKKLQQMGLGAAAGAGGEATIGAVGKMIAPKMGEATKTLTDAGVKLTPGQHGIEGGIAGGEARRAEEALKSFPILGAFIRNAQDQSVESFNRAAINQALEPIGKSLPKGKEVGRNAVKYAAEAYDDAYNALLPNVTFRPDRDFVVDRMKIDLAKQTLPEDQKRQLTEIFKQEIDDRLKLGGYLLDGRTFKAAESELGRLAAQYRGSTNGGEREMSRLLTEARTSMREALARGNPAHAEELGNINAGYALLARLEEAAGRRLSSGGVFSPLDLMAAVKSGDKSRRKADFAMGDALWQKFAEAGEKIIPSKLGESGTAPRLFWGLPMHEKAIGLGVGLPAGLAYKAAQAVTPYIMQPGPYRQAAGQAAGNLGPYIDPALGLLGAGVAGR